MLWLAQQAFPPSDRAWVAPSDAGPVLVAMEAWEAMEAMEAWEAMEAMEAFMALAAMEAMAAVDTAMEPRPQVPQRQLWALLSTTPPLSVVEEELWRSPSTSPPVAVWKDFPSASLSSRARMPHACTEFSSIFLCSA